MSDEIKVYTVKEVCEILKISRTTLYKFVDDGVLTGVRIGKHLRFTHEELNQLIYGKEENRH